MCPRRVSDQSSKRPEIENGAEAKGLWLPNREFFALALARRKSLTRFAYGNWVRIR